MDPLKRRPPFPGALLLGLSLCVCLSPVACRARPTASPAALARLSLRQPGLYRLDRAALRRAGLGWEGRAATDLRLYGEGRERHLLEGPDEGWPLTFVAEGGEEGEQVFLLSPKPLSSPPPGRPQPPSWPGQPEDAPPSAVPLPPELPSPSPGTLPARLHLPLREAWVPERPAGPQLGGRLTAPEARELRFELPRLAGGGAALGLRVWSATEAPVEPDHALELRLNGRPLPEQRWEGAGDRDLWWSVDAGLLRQGANRLSIAAVAPPEVLISSFHPADLWLVYPEPAAPWEGRLSWLGTGSAVRLEGFAPGALAWSAAAGPTVLATADADGRLRVPGQAAGQGFGAADLAAARAPLGIQRAGDGPDLRHPGAGADWLVLAPPALAPALAPLLLRRQAEGLRVALVSSRDVFEQFGAGYEDASALAAFLDHAIAAWQPAPRYVLLVGDAPDLLPGGQVFGHFGGWSASDAALARDGAGRPRAVALGRIPARDPGQLRAALAKLERWEEGPARDGDWRQAALLLADPSEPGFRADAEAFGAALGQAFDLQDAPLAVPPDASGDSRGDVSASILARFEAGLGLTVYIGHGTRTQWGRDRLLDLEGVAALRNAARPGLVLNFSCLIGAFDHPGEASLAEALLLAPRGGAAAVIAPSSLTLATDQSPLAAGLARALADPAVPRLGDALLRARDALDLSRAGAEEVAFSFLLFGDPALRLAGSR